jgi:opacity protein-like surface antigen
MSSRIGVLVIALSLVAVPAVGQTGPGSVEMSLSGNFGSMSSSSEYTSGGHTSTSTSESRSYFGLDLRVGAYVVEGFSLEPEVYVLAVEKTPPAFSFGANAAYTFSIPQSPVKPFITVGYGIGNGIPLMQRLMDRSSSDLDIPVFRAGGGLKVFVSKQVALKVEYRYERYSQDNTTTYYGYTSTSSSVMNLHNVLVGFSFFLHHQE